MNLSLLLSIRFRSKIRGVEQMDFQESTHLYLDANEAIYVRNYMMNNTANTGNKLTKRLVESTKVDDTKEILVWDSELRGFAVRIYPSGRRTYFVQYRNQFNRSRRKKIGVHGVFTTEQAREEAKKILGDVAKGSDPSKQDREDKAKPTMRKLAEEYLAVYAKPNKKPKTYTTDKNIVATIFLPRWGERKIEDITPHDVQTLHRDLKATPYYANRVRALISHMFTIAIKWEWIEYSPVRGVEKYQEHKRNRWLDDTELQRLWQVLADFPQQDMANAVRLLILTGSRYSEVMNATWDQFDLEKGVWTKPAQTTKQKRMVHLPLATQAIDVLRTMQKDTQRLKDAQTKTEQLKAITHPDYLFPGNNPTKPFSGMRRYWYTMRQQAGFPDVRIHDLRHTHASHLVCSGMSLAIVGKLLGHSRSVTTERYAHLSDTPLREAAAVFGDKLATLTMGIKPKPIEAVVVER